MCSVIDSRSSPLSRVLFLSETGKPMRFFMRPGATKTQLQPIISAGGGVVCRVQEPNAILLLDPEEVNEGFGGAAARYVSTQYVLDCVEKNQQLEVDDYRFRDDSVQIAPAKRKREASGRMGYSAEEDAAILGYVRGRVREVCGNRLWKQMEREAVTTHSWQSMKDRYRKHLSKQPLEGDTEAKQTASTIKLFTVPLQQNDPAQSSHRIDLLTPSPEKAQTPPSPEKAQPPPSPSKAQLPLSPEEKNTNRSPEQTRPQPSAEPSGPQPSPERSPPQPSPEKMQPHPSPRKVHLHPPLDQSHPQPATEESAPPASSERTNPPTLEKTSEAVRPHCLAGEGSSVGKDEAGPSTKSTGRNGQLVDTEQVVQDDEEERPSPKKRKLGILERAVMEFEDLDESDDDTPDIALSSATTSADCKKGLGKEVSATTSAVVIQENDEEEEEEEDNDNEDRKKRNAEPRPEKAPEVQTGPPDKDKGPEVNRENVDEDDSEDNSSKDNRHNNHSKDNRHDSNSKDNRHDNHSKDNGVPQPAKAPDVQLACADQDTGATASGLAPQTSAPITSKVHLFLFDRASQEEEEEDSQAASGPPFTQVQLERARQQLRSLMQESGRGLESVSKALLKTGGDAQAARRYLRSGAQRRLWDPRDDALLAPAGPSLLSLEQKYGKVAVARRLAFLDTE